MLTFGRIVIKCLLQNVLDFSISLLYIVYAKTKIK